MFAAPPSSHNAAPAVAPEERIPVEPIGYRPPGSLYILSKMSFSSLDFLDSTHLLFTFHESRLLRREQDARWSDDDQMIHAVVLELPHGRVVATADWRMRDRSRYLWLLGDGKFLLRQRNRYLIGDDTLRLTPFVESPSLVLATEVSPDGRLMVVENELERHTQEQHEKLLQQAKMLGEQPPREDTRISLIEVKTKVLLSQLHVELPVVLPVTSTGFLMVQQIKENHYALKFMPFHGEAVTLGEVASTCTPRETFVNAKTLMIESCGPNTPDLYLDTWTIDGQRLWRGRRDGHSVWPTFALSQSGNRFALGLLRVTHSIDLADSLDDEDVKQQMVQVFDVANGNLLLTTTASPVLTAGQNFALSPDGNQLAVLHDGALEIYDIPSVPVVQAQK